MTASLAASLITVAFFALTRDSLALAQVPLLCGAALITSWYALKLFHDLTPPLRQWAGPLETLERERVAAELGKLIHDYRYPAYEWIRNVFIIGIAGMFYTAAAALIALSAMFFLDHVSSISYREGYDISVITIVLMCSPHVVAIVRLLRGRFRR